MYSNAYTSIIRFSFVGIRYSQTTSTTVLGRLCSEMRDKPDTPHTDHSTQTDQWPNDTPTNAESMTNRRTFVSGHYTFYDEPKSLYTPKAKPINKQRKDAKNRSKSVENQNKPNSATAAKQQSLDRYATPSCTLIGPRASGKSGQPALASQQGEAGLQVCLSLCVGHGVISHIFIICH